MATTEQLIAACSQFGDTAARIEAAGKKIPSDIANRAILLGQTLLAIDNAAGTDEAAINTAYNEAIQLQVALAAIEGSSGGSGSSDKWLFLGVVLVAFLFLRK